MLGVLGLLIVCTLVIWFEVPKLRHKKAKKELWLFYTVLAIGMVVSICKALGLNVPNPSALYNWKHNCYCSSSYDCRFQTNRLDSSYPWSSMRICISKSIYSSRTVI